MLTPKRNNFFHVPSIYNDFCFVNNVTFVVQNSKKKKEWSGFYLIKLLETGKVSLLIMNSGRGILQVPQKLNTLLERFP